MSIENPNFLKDKYKDLNKSAEVDSAVQRHEQRTGETLPKEDAAGRIQTYLNRLNNIVNPPALEGHPDFDRQERNINMLKGGLYDQFVIKLDKIPESYFDSIKRRHRDEGHGDIEIPDDYRQELAATVINDQKKSLDNWVDYLISDDAKYPDWLKYFAFRSMLRMGRYDKQKKSFTERTGGAISPFPELNREALAIVLDSFERQAKGEQPKFGYDIKEDTKQHFLQFLGKKNFAKLYALAIEEFKPIAEELLKVTAGEWVPYSRGSDHQPLVQSISEYGTGWCLRGEAMAQRYLGDNDLYVYYSHDQAGQSKVPRVVMVINANNKIAEVRGIAPEENLDPYIGDVVQKKLNEFGHEGEAYQKKSADMQQLTAIDNKVKASQPLTKDNLIFLYEINSPIEGFGYQRDPRIEELRSARNPHEDAPTVLDCTPEQIAWSEAEVNENTKAYVGPLFPGIFTKLAQLDHLYTKFSEGRVRRGSVEIGSIPKEDIEDTLTQKKINISSYARDLLHRPDFTVAQHPEQIDLVRLTVGDLGFPNGATTAEIYAKADELGLDLCPAEVGPQLRLQEDTEKQFGEYFFVAMKQITVSSGYPGVFYLYRYDRGPWLHADSADPTNGWYSNDAFVFRPRKEPSNA